MNMIKLRIIYNNLLLYGFIDIFYCSGDKMDKINQALIASF